MGLHGYWFPEFEVWRSHDDVDGFYQAINKCLPCSGIETSLLHFFRYFEDGYIDL